MLKRIARYVGRAIAAWFTAKVIDSSLMPWFKRHFAKIEDTSTKVQVALTTA